MSYKKLTLDNITTNITDGTHSTVINDDFGSHYLLSAKNIKNGHVIYDSSDRKISQSTLKELRKRTKLELDDVVITTVGTIGEVAQITDKNPIYEFQRSVAILKPNTQILNSKYFKYLISNDDFKHKASSHSSGSVQKCLFLSTIKNLEVTINSNIEEQKAIANILSSLDDKIELNNKINNNLEQIAQTLYKRWFVDFEFPNENGEPYKSSGGEMVDSELGMIPKGWEVRDVNKLFEFKGGAQPPKEEHIYEHQKGYIRFIQNRDYRDGSNHLTYIKESSKNKLANKYDIMMDKYGEVGKIRYGLEGAYNVALAKIDPYDTLDREFLRGYFSQDNILQYLSNSSIASTRGSLNATTFTGLKVAYPNKHLKLIFKEIQKNTIDMILEKKSENVKLAKIRDELLPKLMSGEIEVPVEE